MAPRSTRRGIKTSRGNSSLALSLAEDRNGQSLQRAVNKFRGLTYARSTRSTMSARMRLWSRLSNGLGIPVVPLTGYGVETICSILRASGYRSAVNYLNSAITFNRDQGHALDVGTEGAIKRARMACTRNLGPPQRMRGITLQELRTLTRKLKGFYAVQRVAGYLLASWFLLRCSELIALDIRHVEFDEVQSVVSITIASSKMDQSAFGCVRQHGCLCSTTSDQNAAICPYHVIWHLVVSRRRQHAENTSPLVSDTRGLRFKKKEFLDSFRADARSCGLVMSENDKLGTHSFRRGGVQLLAISGAATRDQLKHFGRWSSDCIDRYLEDVLIADSPLYASRVVQRYPGASFSLESRTALSSPVVAPVSLPDPSSANSDRRAREPAVKLKKRNWLVTSRQGWVRKDRLLAYRSVGSL